MEQILAELRRFLNDSIAAHHFATFGLKRLETFLVQDLPPPPPENPDPRILFGVGDPNDSSAHPCWFAGSAVNHRPA